MRALFVTMILVPLSGCLGGIGTLDTAELFDYISVEPGDPTPIALDSCESLLDTLNLRIEQRAMVSLHQSYDNELQWLQGGRGGFGDDDAVLEESSQDGGAESPQAAPAADASGKSESGSTTQASAGDLASPEVTGTNTQEAEVDEADIIKTDGTWTYAVDSHFGSGLHILHSSGVGNLTSHSTIQLGDGYGTQLMLVDMGTQDDGDDRLVVVMGGVQDPTYDPEEEKQKEPASNSRSGEAEIAVDYAYPYYYGGQFSRIMVFDLESRTEPKMIEDHYIEGSNVGVRMVDGFVYAVIHQSEGYHGLRSYAGPTEEILEQQGMDWHDYYDASVSKKREILRLSVEDALEENQRVLAGLTLEEHLPGIYHGDGDGNATQSEYNQQECERLVTAPDDMGRSVSTILSLDVHAEEIDFQLSQIMGGYPLVYGATDALVLASSSQEHWWFWAQPELDESTNLHWFDLDGLDVSHRASGRVDGIVQDQFGIDVYDGQLRIASTTGTWGRWWLEDPDPMSNHMFIFEEVAGVLVEKGSVTGFAEDERIWSARFTDERAYIVTFREVDPLWIIDLTNPAAPEIIGEVHVPGVSTYIHPLPGEDALLTIGIGPRYQEDPDAECDDAGDCPAEPVGLDWNRIQVSLFNIEDPANANRVYVYDVSLPDERDFEDDESWESYSWGYSNAVEEHKAFNYWDKLGMLAIPVTWNHYQYSCSQDGNARECVSREEFHTGLELIEVDKEKMTLTKYGSVDQDHMAAEASQEYGYYWGMEVQRSYFLGFPDQFPEQPVSVYAYSNLGVSAHDLETLENQDSVRFFDPSRGNEKKQPAIDETDDDGFPIIN